MWLLIVMNLYIIAYICMISPLVSLQLYYFSSLKDVIVLLQMQQQAFAFS